MKLIDSVSMTKELCCIYVPVYYNICIIRVQYVSLCHICPPHFVYVVDNRTWKPHAKRKQFNVAKFMEPSETFMLSSQQRLAVYQFLTGIHVHVHNYIYFTSAASLY